jgi:hypothetical protein
MRFFTISLGLDQINRSDAAWTLTRATGSPDHNGGSARGYQAIFAPSTALASPGYDGQPAVYLYIAVL